MKKFLLAGMAVLSGFSSIAHAEPVSRDVTITTFHPMAVDRTHCPSCSGITRVYVEPGAWGSTTCRPDAGDLYKEDSHLLSILLTARATGLNVKLEVNDAVRPIDTVCKITAVWVN